MPTKAAPFSERAIDGQINTAVRRYNRASSAHEAGRFNRHHATALRNAITDIAQLLARFEDGHWYGRIDEDTRLGMVNFIAEADALLDIADPPRGRIDRRVPALQRGQYIVIRELKINGVDYRSDEKLTCNPAAAKLALDAWEAQIRRAVQPDAQVSS